MKAASLTQIKKELETCTHARLVDISIQLSKYKTENKELLSFILFDSDDITTYIADIKYEIDEAFYEMHSSTYYISYKKLRKVIRSITKYAKISGSKNLETELLIHFCDKFISVGFADTSYRTFWNILNGQVKKIERNLPKVHEDLAFDYRTKVKKYYRILEV